MRTLTRRLSAAALGVLLSLPAAAEESYPPDLPRVLPISKTPDATGTSGAAGATGAPDKTGESLPPPHAASKLRTTAKLPANKNLRV